MRFRAIGMNLLAIATIGGIVMAAAPVSAQDWRDDASHHRQQQKNQWRNIAIDSGALGLLGLVKHDNTLTFAGAAGALYATYRYEQDRKSQSRIDRARAGMFSRTSFYRNGHR